ncbi:MAG: outer membrane beta-barrel protein, partial [Bdellovibrionia bacterium]
LAGCGDASYERGTKVQCHDRSASVLLKTDLFRYNAELFSSVGKSGKISWEVIGQMTQSELDQVADLGPPLPFVKPPKIKITPPVIKPVVNSDEELKEEEVSEAVEEVKLESGGDRKIASLGIANPNPYAVKEASPSDLSFSLMLDGYYSYNLNQPPAIVSAVTPYLISPNTNIRAYDFYHNTFSLNVAEITVKKTSPEISFTADLDFGPQAEFLAAGMTPFAIGGPRIGPAEAVSKVLGQIFVTYTPTWAPNLTIGFGKMASHMGLEGWKSRDNWQYSRSTIFLFGLPRWHMGVSAGYYLLPKNLSLSAYVYNSWNSIYDNNATKTLGAQLNWTPSDSFSFIYNYIGGPEQPGNDTNMRTVHEASFSWKLDSGTLLALETVVGHEDGITLADTSIVNTDWIGAYFSAKYSLSSRFYISPRLEIYGDLTGANLGGDQQTLFGFTLTNSFKVAEGFEARLELREDASTYGQRFNTISGLSNNQTTITLGVIYSMD